MSNPYQPIPAAAAYVFHDIGEDCFGFFFRAILFWGFHIFSNPARSWYRTKI